MATTRKKKFNISLTPAEEERLLRTLNDPNYEDVLRKRCAILLSLNESHGNYCTLQECAEKNNVAYSTVSKTVNQYAREGLDGLLVRKRSPLSDVARLKLTPETIRIIRNAAESAGGEHISLRKIRKIILQQNGLDIGIVTIAKALRQTDE